MGYSAAAVAGYASISVPAGLAEDGRPGCVFMSGRFLDEPKLIGLAYDLEQELGARDIPQFLGSVAGPFADAGICSTPLRGRQSWSGRSRGAPAGRRGSGSQGSAESPRALNDAGRRPSRGAVHFRPIDGSGRLDASGDAGRGRATLPPSRR